MIKGRNVVFIGQFEKFWGFLFCLVTLTGRCIPRLWRCTGNQPFLLE